MKSAPFTRLAQSILFVIIAAVVCPAQPEKSAATPDEKAEKIVQRAVEAVGGKGYLGVQTVTGRGFFTDYREGVSQIPVKFVDYILYPDRERTEFTGAGQRIIQTNHGDKGWLFDGAAKTLKDQNAEQIEDFRVAMRTSMENLLRGWWRDKGATLSYLGRREAGLARRNETVRLTYPDGFWIEYEFAANDGLPAKVLYKRKHRKADSDEMEDVLEEDRLQKPINISGVVVPFVIDHFRNNVQTSRINYESVEHNRPLADSLFAKPANIKAVK